MTSSDEVVITCPVCGESARVYKVTKIFVESLEGNRLKETADERLDPSVGAHAGKKVSGSEAMRKLSKRFGPPTKRLVQPRGLHPDQVVLVMTFLALVLLWHIFTQQRGALLPALGVFAAALILYAMNRKRLLAKHGEQHEEVQRDKKEIERATERWGETYYCAVDDVVFIAGSSEAVPADEMMNMLFS